MHSTTDTPSSPSPYYSNWPSMPNNTVVKPPAQYRELERKYSKDDGTKGLARKVVILSNRLTQPTSGPIRFSEVEEHFEVILFGRRLKSLHQWIQDPSQAEAVPNDDDYEQKRAFNDHKHQNSRLRLQNIQQEPVSDEDETTGKQKFENIYDMDVKIETEDSEDSSFDFSDISY